MHPNCRAAVSQRALEIGREGLTDADLRGIDERMARTMRRLAGTEKDWRAMSRDQRISLAAEQALADIKAEAARKVENAERQVLATAATEQRITDATTRQGWGRSRALVEDMERTRGYIDGVKRDYARNLMELIEASQSRQGANVGRQALMVLFDAQNPAMTRDLALEVFAKGEAGTGNREAVAGAKAWLEVTDAMRQRFNAAGGDVGQLEYGYLPQSHDMIRVLARGKERWAAEVLPMLNRDRYLREDGTRMNDAEVMDILRASWETIATDGANKTAPGQFRGNGARANRGAESREIHFKDGEAYLEYMGRFGVGNMYDAMIGHIGGLSRDIGLIERYGPNPEAQMRLQFDLAKRADGPRDTAFGDMAEGVAGPEAQWRVLSGTAGAPQYARLAQIGHTMRNIQVFAKLAGAVLSSLTDLGTYVVTTGYNRLPYFEALANIGRAATGDARDFMNAHGLIAESMISDLNRWSGENIRQAWSGKVANATMRLSLMNAWTDTLRRGFQLTHMAGVGRMHGTAWDALAPYDRWRMESKGMTADDWAVIQRSELVDYRGMTMLTPDAIHATGDPRAGEVVAKYLAMIVDESEIAVLNPDLTTRAITTMGGRQAGSVDGELWRAVAQFKSFPIAIISRHWRRVMDTPQGLEGAPMLANRLAYAGALMASLTALGAIVFQTKQIVGGKDPVDMTTPKFWTRAFAQGGGLGFVGDMLLTDTSDDRSPMDTLGRALLGPSFGTAADLYELTKGNLDELRAGKNTQAGAEALRFTRGHLPLVNLWYARTALDHAGLQSFQESLSPGYLARIKNKARKDWNQEFWWRPGETLPERGPSFADIAGQ